MHLKNRFRNDSSNDIDYSVKTIWNTTGKLLQEKCYDEYKLTFNPFFVLIVLKATLPTSNARSETNASRSTRM
jgi:hypothetical protein